MSYPEVRKAILLVAGLYLLYRFVGTVTAILFLFFAVLILAMALNPIVNWLAARRVPRAAGAVLIALALLALLTVAALVIVPPMVAQGEQFVRDAPGYWAAAQSRVERILERFPVVRERLATDGQLGQEIVQHASNLIRSAGRYTVTAAGLVFALLLALILTVYALAQPCPLVKGLLGAVPAEHREKTRTALIRIASQVRAWVVASVLLGAVVAFVAWLGLTLLGVPNALLLAMLAFFGEAVPNFGPIVAAIPAILIAFAVSPITALWVAVLYVAIQQVESYLLAPLIMGKQLHLHPITVAFFVLVMGALAGLIGAILAVPTAAIARILYEEFYYKPRHPDEEAITRDANEVIAA
jgi:putative permease